MSVQPILTFSVVLYGSPKVERNVANYQHDDVCQAISKAISSKSTVSYPGSTLYAKDVYHYSNSSTQESACTVEPGSTKDVGVILRVLGATRTPFGVKSGGHAMNPGFSSSKGVQIALYKFNDVDYDAKTQSVVIGAGLNFDDVYATLAPNNVSVAGGRVTGIGVGGFMLGGGYSWKANQYGLGIDTIIGYELVKPDGKVAQVTKKSDAELFFGLKGGYNNFGIVTRFTVKALPQSSLWGGTILFPESSVHQVTAAVIKFSGTNNDAKANIIPSYIYYKDQIMISQMFYYDSSTLPPGFFDDFLTAPSTSADVRSRSLTNFIANTVSNSSAGLRGVYHTVPLLEHTQNVMKVIQNETIFWGKTLHKKTGTVSYSVEPFLPSILSHNDVPTAYPPTRDKVYFPLNINFAWELKKFDNDFFDAIRQSATRIRDAAIAEGQDIANAPLYPNYALFDTPLKDMYGDNVGRLMRLRKRVDPLDVMGLTGGFKF